jgi:redox-sensitive bicupin YhaK (pirin superfamily)
MRSIDKVINAEMVWMGKFEIAQPLPVKGLKQVDPFLLLHHAGPKYHEPGAKGLNVEAHPHSGFEPVTFVFSGEVEHRDSLGNNNTIRSGGVQWITAGKGIVHSEKASPAFTRKGGEFEIIQLWINLPVRLKKTNPSYTGYEVTDIPFYVTENKKARLNIIAGKYNDITGPVKSLSGITAYTAMMEQQGSLNLSFSRSENVIIYLLNGQISVDNHDITDKQLIVFKNDKTNITLNAKRPSKLLILAGIPFREPVFHYGPFVLNSKDEVIEAIKDYESGKMGYLE